MKKIAYLIMGILSIAICFIPSSVEAKIEGTSFKDYNNRVLSSYNQANGNYAWTNFTRYDKIGESTSYLLIMYLNPKDYAGTQTTFESVPVEIDDVRYLVNRVHNPHGEFIMLSMDVELVTKLKNAKTVVIRAGEVNHTVFDFYVPSEVLNEWVLITL